MERIAGLRHVKLGERPPGAADGVEGAALAASQELDVIERVLDDLLGLLNRVAGAVLQGEAAERQRVPGSMRAPWTSTSSSEPPPRSPTMPSGRWKPETTPSAVSSASRWPEITSILVRQICSAAAMKSLPLRASRQAAVASTHNRCDLHGVAQRTEALQRLERLLDRVGRQQALGLHLAAEAGERLFVEQRRRAAGDALVDDEAHRVRADVDHRDRRPIVEPALRRARGGGQLLKHARPAG